MSARHLIAAGAAALLLSAAAPQLHAEEADSYNGPAFAVSLVGGGFNTLSHLDDNDNTNFKTGFAVGGGLGYQFNKYVAIRGNFTFARAEAQSDLSGIAISSTKFNRFLYDGDLQFRYPFKIGRASCRERARY